MSEVSQPNEQLKEELPYWSHDCPETDDNYGSQLVKKGRRCPFCWIEEPKGEDTHE